MYKWEYHKEVCNTSISAEKLNELGAKGWEHYAVSGNAHYFKRQSTDQQKVTHNAAKSKR